MKKIYLDMNIFNRPFDDQLQVRIKLETIAINSVFNMIEDNKFSLLWSFMLEFENSLNPSEDVRTEIEMVSKLASDNINISKNILKTALDMEGIGIKSRDSMHLACAVKGKAQFFLTCDDRLVKKGQSIKESAIMIMNPVDFVRTEVK